MLAATDALDRLFSTDNPLLRLARDIGIAAVQPHSAVEAAVHAPGDGCARGRRPLGRSSPPG